MRPALQATSVSWIPVQPAAPPQTPDRPVDDPVQKQPGPVQPDGAALQMVPFQVEPVVQIPAETDEKREFPLSEISNVFAPKLIVRTSDPEPVIANTVPPWETVGVTGLFIDQLTVMVQVLEPAGILHEGGTTNEPSVGGFGAHRAPLHELPGPQAALEGRVASEVPLSESSKIFKPKSRLAVNPGLDARVEICVPS